jgi:hypothetical protein
MRAATDLKKKLTAKDCAKPYANIAMTGYA